MGKHTLAQVEAQTRQLIADQASLDHLDKAAGEFQPHLTISQYVEITMRRAAEAALLENPSRD